jgi:beta-galactosidase/beta-glucuronidase
MVSVFFAKGGNWGMDDAMKQISRERLEPAFRLHREANFNMIRNWTGVSFEPVFFDLADEYGMMVWKRFLDKHRRVQPESCRPGYVP